MDDLVKPNNDASIKLGVGDKSVSIKGSDNTVQKGVATMGIAAIVVAGILGILKLFTGGKS
jgi:hypothetical protein